MRRVNGEQLADFTTKVEELCGEVRQLLTVYSTHDLCLNTENTARTL